MEQENPMGSKPMLPLLVGMAIPPMFSMLIQSLYNIVDSIFVAQISESALSAVSIVYPLQNIALSVAVGTGIGLNSYISRKLGAKDMESANNACIIGFILSFFHYLLVLVLGMFILSPFIRSFAGNETVYNMGMGYGTIIIVFSFGQLLHIPIEKIFQATGKMMIPMLLQGLGCIINIVLDPILIFGLFGFPAMGVNGAALATVIGQIASFLLAFLALVKGKSGLKIQKFNSSLSGKDTILQIYKVAIPSTLVMSLPSVLVAGLNALLTQISVTAVSVFGIYYKLQTFVYMPTNGLIQGFRPIMGYNYGAGHIKREKEAIGISFCIVSTIMAIGTLLFFIFPASIMSFFNATPEMKEIGIPLLRIISIGFLPSGISIILCSIYESMGNGKTSLLITLLRQIIIILPLSFAFSRFMGLYGIWVSFTISEV
ncbi:MAG: MATE family efflux transporter, partial [Acetivibrio sp.]